MSQIWLAALQSINHLFHSVVNDNSTVPLSVIATYSVGSLALYFLTRGKEFLIAGYSSVLFLVPFVHLI